MNIPSDDIPRDNPPDQLDHPISHPRDDVNREQPVRVPTPVFLFPAVQDLGLSSRSGIADQEGHRDETESEDGIGEDGPGRETFHERGDEDRADLLGPVRKSVSITDMMDQDGRRTYTLHGGIGTR